MSFLDEQQVERISRVHRGFLYQHALTALFIISLYDQKIGRIRVESDEDIEIGWIREGIETWSYVQVKTTSDPLTFSELRTTIKGFFRLAELHRQGTRHPAPEFIVVCVGPLGAELDQARATGTIPKLLQAKIEEIAAEAGVPNEAAIETFRKIGWITPNCSFKVLGSELPGTIAEVIEKGTKRLSTERRLATPPETAFSKLCFVVSMIATGQSGFLDRTINFEQAASMIDRIALLAHRVPNLPDGFLAVSKVGPILIPGKKTLLIGPPGAGKSSQIAWEVMRSPAAQPVCYVTVQPSGEDEAVDNLARALAAAFSEIEINPTLEARVNASMVPIAEKFAALGAAIPKDATIIIENLHLVLGQLPALEEFLHSCLDRTDVTVCLSGQPRVIEGQTTVGQLATAARGAVEVCYLTGWDTQEIVTWFSWSGYRVTLPQAEAIHEITGGHPLFVRGLLQTIEKRFNGNIHAGIQAIRATGMPIEMIQNTVLAQLLQGLDEQVISLAMKYQLAEMPLYASEVERVSRSARRARRVLTELGVLTQDFSEPREYGTPPDVLHSAYGELLKEFTLERLDRSGEIEYCGKVVDAVFQDAITHGISRTRLIPFYRLLFRAEAFKTIAALISGSGPGSMANLVRLGVDNSFLRLLETALADNAIDDETRFWLLDSLIFARIAVGEVDGTELLLSELTKTFHSIKSPDPELAYHVAHKELLVAGRTGNLKKATDVWESYAGAYREVIDHTYATCLFKAGLYLEALRTLVRPIRSYLDTFGIRYIDIWEESTKNVRDVMDLTNVDSEKSDIARRLADCLQLASYCLVHIGEPALALMASAANIYNCVHDFDSVVKMGNSIVECLIKDLGVPSQAVEAAKKTVTLVETLNLKQHWLEAHIYLAFAFAAAKRKDELDKTVKLIEQRYIIDEHEMLPEIRHAASRIYRPNPGRLMMRPVTDWLMQQI